MQSVNLLGDLAIMKQLKIIPNFSSLAREYGKDRHTIAKYYHNNGIPKRKTVTKVSKWDPFKEEIELLFNQKHVSKAAAYNYLAHKYKDKLPGNYNSFRSYTLRKKLAPVKANISPHPLYETPPGKQLQFDWKENLSISLKDGTKLNFNVFSATLSYSRQHIFIYSKNRTVEELIRCIIETFKRLGGTSEEALTDNMSSIVSFEAKSKHLNPRIAQLFKDLNVRLKLCKVRSPQTKGKDENANKYLNWLKAYDGELESEMELIDIIENVITSQANTQINSRTKLPPLTLFQKEKEYLKPLGNNLLLENYIKQHKRELVPATQLIYFKGKRYSLPTAYIGKYVDIYLIDQDICIYHNGILVAKHTISHNSINYDSQHYLQALGINDSTEETIKKRSLENLELLKRLN